jgi:fibronectin type 3 domain-containing protein
LFKGGVIDNTPPSKPGGLSATPVSHSQVDLSWGPASDAQTGVDYYKIYRDGVQIDTATDTTYSDTGLSPGTTYSYEVSAVNGAGLEGAKSDPASATTLADQNPPAISSVSATGETTVAVVFSEPAEKTSAESRGNYSIDNGVTVNSASLGGDGKTATLTVSTLTEGVTYTLTATGVKDLAGNPASDSKQFTYTAELVMSGVSQAGYVVAELHNGELQYIDRGVTFTSVGAYDGMKYIRTANDDKSATANPFLTFEVNVDVTVYVAYDNRNALPAWLASWTDTRDDIAGGGWPDGASVFAKDFAAGAVSLGANENGGSMYNVVVAPAGAGPVTRTITATAGAGGTIDPLGAVSVADGASQSFTITPDPGHEVEDVLVDSSSVGAVSSYTFTNVTADHAIEASFAAMVDSDSDGLADGWELTYFATLADCNPSDDPDSDGLTNAEEYAASTDPTKADTDSDGLTDGAEVSTHGTSPTNADTDLDGLTDGAEVGTHGTDPTKADTDSDGMPDGWELANGLDPASGADAGLDPDSDGHTNLEEFLGGSDPWDAASVPSAGVADGSTGWSCAAGRAGAYPSAAALLLLLLVRFALARRPSGGTDECGSSSGHPTEGRSLQRARR